MPEIGACVFAHESLVGFARFLPSDKPPRSFSVGGMTWQISEWGKYSDLLQQLSSMQLDWSSWPNLTTSIAYGNPGLWGAVPENAFFGYGLAELLGEIYQVEPTDVDLDDASQLKATDQHVLDMLWHIVHAQPATDVAGYEGWDDYFVCEEPDGSVSYATARDAEEWTPVPDDDDDEGEGDEGEPEADEWDSTDEYEDETQEVAPDEAEVPDETVEAATFATTEEAEEGAALVTGLVQGILDDALAALPEDVIVALSPQDLENLAVEASRLIAADI
jgi:hypothetical protein